MKPVLPTQQEFRAMFDDAYARNEMWASLSDELVERYAGLFVAIVDGAVVAHGSELSEVRAALDGLDLQGNPQVLVDYVWPRGTRIAL